MVQILVVVLFSEFDDADLTFDISLLLTGFSLVFIFMFSVLLTGIDLLLNFEMLGFSGCHGNLSSGI